MQKRLFDVTAEAGTIKTGNSVKDQHAKSEGWLDVSKFPKISFTSTRFYEDGNQKIVLGMLELHGVKKEVKIPYDFVGKEGLGIFSGKFTISRKDFGINGNAMASLMDSDIEIELKIPVKK